MLLALKVAQGPDQGRDIPLPNGASLKIGRGEKSDVRLNDPSVSRVHCEVSCQGPSVMVRDLGSTGGTLLNDQPVEISELRVGSKIQLGDTVLLLIDQSSSDTTMVVPQEQPSVRPLEEMVGSRINHYRLDRVIGRGQSGFVFEGFDEEKQRKAAVKILAPQYTRLPTQRDRFVRAMKTMIPIRCANIIRIYNAGITGPYCWTAMEYVEGENLAQLISRIGIDGMLDWKKVWRVAMNIGQALETAYEHKIVHRNVTPTNILRRSSDESCLLGDLMLAKAMEGELAVQITQAGQLIGELEYLAPERTTADGAIDIRSDIYGLGATCYALLTGRPPAQGKNLADLLNSIRNETPPAPRDFQLSTNEHFQDLILVRMLAKDPANRFQTPMALLEELRRIGKYNNLSL